MYLNNRRQTIRFDCAQSYRHAFFPQRFVNPNSYLHNQVRLGNPIAPAMSIGHTTATNGGNPIAPAMMSYSQFQQSRARAIQKSAPRVRVRSGGRR